MIHFLLTRKRYYVTLNKDNILLIGGTMNLKEVIGSDKMNFTGIESSYFLLGLLSAFENRF